MFVENAIADLQRIIIGSTRVSSSLVLGCALILLCKLLIWRGKLLFFHLCRGNKSYIELVRHEQLPSHLLLYN